MKECSKCGRKIPDDQDVCANCTKEKAHLFRNVGAAVIAAVGVGVIVVKKGGKAIAFVGKVASKIPKF